MPSRKVDRSRLRSQYVADLAKYEGTRYVWGGEGFLGIDCSGLIRCGFINAHLKLGLRTANGELLRESFSLWWFDSSARAMRDEDRERTKLLFEAESIKEIDYDKISPGDFVVTSDGIHTLAYLGHNVWIEADPALKKVVCLDLSSDSEWLTVPVCVMRWQQFD